MPSPVILDRRLESCCPKMKSPYLNRATGKNNAECIGALCDTRRGHGLVGKRNAQAAAPHVPSNT
eukprot:7646300-Heterocapsa_arctica.AAC.1